MGIRLLGEQFLQLSFWSVLGTLARMAMTKLTNYDYSYINTVNSNTCLWSNYTACFIMAFVSNSQDFWFEIIENETDKIEKANEKADYLLYTGLTTGFCGTFSTFSSLVLECFEKAMDPRGDLPDHGYGVMEFIDVLLVQLGVSVIGWVSGREFISFCESHNAFRHPGVQAIRRLEWALEICGACLIVVSVVLAATLSNWWKPWALSCCFAPVAATLRYKLAVWFNGRMWFPWGTFIANLGACTVLGVLMFGVHGLGIHNTHLTCIVLVALQNGFCGTLSTTSTFVGELVKLQGYRRYAYLATSISVCLLSIVLTYGVYTWTVGFRTAICHY